MNPIEEKIRKINREYHYFNTIADDIEEQQKNSRGKLAGKLISIKDCICVKGMESTAGSKILSTYKPLFDATVVERIRAEGGIIIGKTSQDEFGFGSFNINVGVDFKVPLNPHDKTRVTGGSSGGAAGATLLLDNHIAIAESTGGSIVTPASFCGVFGLCPTYGLVSRYGLMDYANSLDKIGPMAKTMKDIALALTIIAGYDEKDSTSTNKEKEKYGAYLGQDIKELKIGVVKEFKQGFQDAVQKKFDEAIKKLQNAGAQIKEISLPLTTEYALSCYYIIATSEASTNLAKYCGLRYGYTEDLEGSYNEFFAKIRSNGFGKEAKRRIILGTFARMAGYRDAYYIKALKVRTKIIQEYKKAFEEVDIIATPTMPILPPKFEEIEKLSPLQNYLMDILTVGPNLAGMPHLNVPIGKEKNLPVGLLLTANHFEEKKLIQVGDWYERN
ncbi:MAG: Asp-tRNA(Asn)/Glu-tRNA(Gln) amidotransferase subunit GatA [Candidatus Woesearchaeota archaeon]